MKGKYTAIIAIVALTVVATACVIAVLPDQIPAHYNIKGEVDRYGSKFESLILPGFAVIVAAAFIWLAKLRAKKGDRVSERIFLLSGIIVSLVMLALTAFFLLKTANLASGSGSTIAHLDSMKVVSVVLGAMLMAMGFVMPGMKRINSIFGLRTKWSVKNQRVWEECQRFAGISAIIAGIIIIIAGVMLSGAAAIAAVLAVVILWGIICFAVSKSIYDKDA